MSHDIASSGFLTSPLQYSRLYTRELQRLPQQHPPNRHNYLLSISILRHIRRFLTRRHVRRKDQGPVSDQREPSWCVFPRRGSMQHATDRRGYRQKRIQTEAEGEKLTKTVVFSKSWCPYCKATKSLLDEFGAKFRAIELDQLCEFYIRWPSRM